MEGQPTATFLPLAEARVAAGFPSPAADYVEGKLDLNEYLIRHPAATFLVRVEGESMTGAGIFPGDILVVDRSVEAEHGKVVIAVLDGELTVKRLCLRGAKTILKAENSAYPDIDIHENADFQIWGVVTSAIHVM